MAHYGGMIGAFARALCDAERRLDVPPEHLDAIAYIESFGDTSLGFGGFAGQAMSSALVTAITDSHREFVVYVGGRFAYRLVKPDGVTQYPQRFDTDVRRAWNDRCFADYMHAENTYGPWLREKGPR